MKTLLRAAAPLVVLALLVVGLDFGRPTVAADPKTTPQTPGELVIVGKNGQPARACPLKHTDVDAQISGFIARVNVVQQFHNPTQEKIEAIYTFPLPDDSAVDRMEMKVGERTIVGEIKKREEAQEIYQAAKEAGQVASLLDQERSNIFTQSVANIEPGEQVTITISYTQLLKYEAGEYEFVFPTVVGPRYMPGGMATGKAGTGTKPDTDRVPDASKISPPITPEGTRAGHDISIKVQISAGIQLISTKSQVHECDYNFQDETSCEVVLKDQATIPNKDFVLKYSVAGDEVQNGVITHSGEKGGFFALIMQPPKSPKPAQVTPKEMIFILDTSGSQGGEPIKKSKATLWHCIKNLNKGDTFNIIAFSNQPRMLFEAARPYTAENEAAALKYVADCEANGGTEIIPALKVSLPIPADPNHLRIVVFFSDGYVGNDMEIVDYCQKNLNGARIFTFGIGGSVNRFVLSKMAEVGRGAADFVLLNSDEQKIAQKFYERIRNPLLTDIEIDWNGMPVAVDEVYPKSCPDLFCAQPLIVKGRYTANGAGKITVKGKLGGQSWSADVPVTFADSQNGNDSLCSIWARSKVEDLMDQDWLGAQQGNPKPEIKQAVVDTALEYGLMTQYTSFVAVEKLVITQGGPPRTITVPVEMPEGVEYEEGVAIDKLDLSLGQRSSLGRSGGYGGYGGSAKASARVPASSAPQNHFYGYTTNSGITNGAVAATPARPPAKPGEVRRGTAVKSKTKTSAGAAPATGAAPMVLGDMAFDGDYVAEAAKPMPETAEQKRARLISQRLDKTLKDLIAKYRKSGKSGSYAIENKLVAKDGHVEVMIWLRDGSKSNIDKLAKGGLTRQMWARKGRILVGWVPISKLEDLAQIDFIARIAPPGYE